MKQSKRKSFFGAVNLTVSVLALGLLIGLFTGCPPGVKPPETPETVTITLTGDENVTVNAPNTLEVTKGSKWSGVRSKVEEKVSYKPGYEAKGFKLGSAIGADLQDNYIFNENKTVFVLSKPKGGSIQPSSITITVDADEGYTLVSPSNFEVTSGAKWADIKAQAQAKVSLKAGCTALEWKLGGASGAYLDGNHTFNKSTTVFAVSKQNGDPEPETVGITVLGDEGVELAVENTFKADKNVEWQNIKAAATGKITVKENCELKEWRLTDKTGQIIEDNNTFTEDTTVFAVTRPKSSPIPQIANYTVEHWQQNIADNEYTKIEADTETKTGNAGENTAAAAKTYVGFTEKPIIQKKIEADGSTVVKIEYDRNIITLMLNLDGGTTTTQLTDGNKLKGRFGSPVTVAEPVKEGEIFGGWEPDLPDTFPAQNHSEVYTAQWGDSFIIKISGDERTQIPKNTYIKPEGANTWSEISEPLS
ncbi:hypothetical protein E4O00_10690 [Treponema sp. OMZ 788]|uniref:hypothetical protein n=1 Tax=Treponema sp. OMZ 788 TaxID=2563664 RepID=UPI0020A52342|nr:hypothetical protein [Treponema sp. OMZ 788]UTC64283.1 hypothetical protein E4O00_10690 [Treponema sp. OMZ 788]